MIEKLEQFAKDEERSLVIRAKNLRIAMIVSAGLIGLAVLVTISWLDDPFSKGLTTGFIVQMLLSSIRYYWNSWMSWQKHRKLIENLRQRLEEFRERVYELGDSISEAEALRISKARLEAQQALDTIRKNSKERP